MTVLNQDLPSAGAEQIPSGGEVVRIGGGWRAVIRELRTNRSAMVGVTLILLAVLFSFVGPLFYRTDQVHTQLGQAFLPPSGAHPLGTDNVGHDELGRLMLGGQTSLEVGFAAALVATVLGVVWGAIAGYFGGVVDAIMMRIVDAFLAIPSLFLLLYLFTVFRANALLLIFVIGIVAWLVPARLVRAEALTLREREFAKAVGLFGGGSRRTVFRHIIPNTVGTVVVNGTFQVADAILAIAGLSYLGLGIPPPAANWGGMLSTGINYIYAGHWWLIYPPGIAIIVTVVAFNLLGDGLRDALESRLQQA